MYTGVLVAIVFMTSQRWQQQSFQPTENVPINRRMNDQGWYIHTMEHYPTIKRKDWGAKMCYSIG